MSVAFDAVSFNGGSGDQSFTHTPVGTPRAVVVLIAQVLSGTDSITGVTYGGVAMTEIPGSPNLLVSGEAGASYGYFLGRNIPTGPRTVVVSTGSSQTKRTAVYTLTADTDTTIEDSDGTINSASQANPQVTLSLNSLTCWCAIAFMSGQGDPSGITPFANWTAQQESDHGSTTTGHYTYDIVGTSDVTAGWTQAADDACAIAIAVREGPFPEVVGRDGGDRDVNGTNHTINLPDGSNVVGRRLIVFFGVDGDQASGDPGISWPAGWTEMFGVNESGLIYCRAEARYRVIDGTEGFDGTDDTITITTTLSEMSAHVSYLIEAYGSELVEDQANSGGNTANPDPPSLTPSWGADDSLWIAGCCYDRGDRSVSDYPDNYSNGQSQRSNNSVGVGVATCEREYRATSDDPNTFTISSGQRCVVWTVALQPGAGTGAPPDLVVIHTRRLHFTPKP
jgi:hypothetical protein